MRQDASAILYVYGRRQMIWYSKRPAEHITLAVRFTLLLSSARQR